MSNQVIEAEGLSKRFGDVDAVDGVSFAVDAGRVLGLLGPNGAGKTTLVKMVTTLLSIDSGTARVGGFDVSFDEYPGGHDTRDKVPQLIESIAAASGEA